MDELTKIEAPKPPVPTKWNFKTADKNFDKYIRDWRRLSINVVSELWVFYQKLAFKTGSSESVPDGTLPTWRDWLEAKGIGKETPLRHFKALGWMKAAPHVSHNTGENEWYTPPKFIKAAREVMGGIDTDPASSKVANKTIRADTYYDVKDDGLEQEWGKTVWINPPYSQPEISQFCETLLQKLATGEVEKACALVNNATETSFGQQLLKCCDAVCFPSGRIKFLDIQGNEGAPLQGQMIVYFGCLADKFCAEFEQFGVCLHAR